MTGRRLDAAERQRMMDGMMAAMKASLFVRLLADTALALPDTTQVSGDRHRGESGPGICSSTEAGRVRRLTLVG